jgi:hypothetical protein
MAHGRVEQQIDALRRLGEDGASPETAAALRKGLKDRAGMVVAKAAQVTVELQLKDLLPELLHAFDRLFENAVQRDPQCWGKNAIAKALAAFDHRESPPFGRGSRHVQMEPVWGGQEDTASNLRGICVLALASCTDISREEILRRLLDSLADRAYTVRMEAARAIAQMGGDEAALLLRLKGRLGDAEPRVAGQVFDCLLELEGDPAVGFVAEFLDSGSEEAQAEAALSLGSSRRVRAVEALEAAYGATHDPDLRLAILRGLSVSRQERAIDMLLEIVRAGRQRDAALAREALEVHKGTPEIWDRVERASADRHEGI